MTVLDAVDIATAAQILGVSTQAVHKRIRRGTLTAAKRDGRWSVILPGGIDVTSTVIDSETSSQSEPSMETGKTHPRPSRTTADPLLMHLQEEVQFLREELARRGEELRDERKQRAEELLRKDQIIAALTQRFPALSAPSPTEQPAPPSESVTAMPRSPQPWWAFWRRGNTATRTDS